MLSWDKKGVSNVVGYVLLITITISISVLVYNWLMFYVTDDDVVQCPEGVKVIVSEVSCVEGDDGYFVARLKNKGRFSVDGYSVSVHDRADAEFGLYDMSDVEGKIAPGQDVEVRGNFTDVVGATIDDITLIDVSSYVVVDGEAVYCDSVVERVECD